MEEIDWSAHEEKLHTKPLDRVELDAIALLKIGQHVREDPCWGVGKLVGIDVEGAMKVSNAFAVTKEDEEIYVENMISSLEYSNYDSNLVGWYQPTDTCLFWDKRTIEIQYAHQKENPQAILIVVDTSRRKLSSCLQKGTLKLTAMQLTSTFMTLFGDGKFGMEIVNKNPCDIFKFFPIKVHQSYLVKAMFNEILVTGSHGEPSPYDGLDITSDCFMEKHLEGLIDSIEEYGQEQWRW